MIKQQISALPECCEKGRGGVLLPFEYWVRLFKVVMYISSHESHKLSARHAAARRACLKNGDMQAYQMKVQEQAQETQGYM